MKPIFAVGCYLRIMANSDEQPPEAAPDRTLPQERASRTEAEYAIRDRLAFDLERTMKATA